MMFLESISKVILESIYIREFSLTVDTDCRKYCKYLTNDGKIVIPTKLIFYRRRNYGLFMLSVILDE